MDGIYRLLSITPLWVTCGILYFIFIGVLHIGREHFEGFAYNVAWSSQFGDFALIMIILISSSILQKNDAYGWYSQWTFQISCALCSLTIGIIVNLLLLPAEEVMDRYHNFIVVPGLIFLLTTTLPVTFTKGSVLEIASSISLYLFWLALVIADNVTGRINQKKWLAEKGILKNKRKGLPM